MRQGYLLSADILIRPLIERIAILSYLEKNPAQVETWKSGWQRSARPSLAEMLKHLVGNQMDQSTIEQNVIGQFNHLIHGDPFGASTNLIDLGDGRQGYASSKHLNNPALCDEICVQATMYLVVLMSLMASYFPDVE